MKKLLAILLATTMLLMAIPVLAEGNTTDKAITFMDFNYGDTFNSIRSSKRIFSIRFRTEMMSPRNLADVNDRVGEWSQVSDFLPVCFSASLSTREVAGHECNPNLYFVYPVENGSPVLNEGEATFYAGEYEFQGGDARETFDDLAQKLTQVYGEPHTVGNSLDGVLGEATIPQDRQQEYAEQVGRLDPSYVVWVSTVNNAVLVLKYYQEGNDFSRTKLDYISLDAMDIFAQIEAVNGGSGSNSVEGL